MQGEVGDRAAPVREMESQLAVDSARRNTKVRKRGSPLLHRPVRLPGRTGEDEVRKLRLETLASTRALERGPARRSSKLGCELAAVGGGRLGVDGPLREHVPLAAVCPVGEQRLVAGPRDLELDLRRLACDQLGRIGPSWKY